MGNTSEKISLDFIEERELDLDGTKYYCKERIHDNDKTTTILPFIEGYEKFIIPFDKIHILPDKIKLVIKDIEYVRGFKGSSIYIYGDIYDNPRGKPIFTNVLCSPLYNINMAFKDRYKPTEKVYYYIEPLENVYYAKPKKD